jgi:hypothetical protein
LLVKTKVVTINRYIIEQGRKMKLKYLVVLALLIPTLAQAGAIATMPNEGGGFIVLTDDQCKHEDKVYKGLNRLYSYTSQGHNAEGCYGVEDDTVVAIWTPSGSKMRYPISAFTLTKKKGVRYGT